MPNGRLGEGARVCCLTVEEDGRISDYGQKDPTIGGLQMNTSRSRREFLAEVGQGMLIATVGAATASDLGLARAFAEQGSARLNFGALEPLVQLMQETPVNKLLPTLVEKMKAGVELRQFVAAAALANARTFGGEDYVGFHTMMALAPALVMSRELPTRSEERR